MTTEQIKIVDDLNKAMDTYWNTAPKYRTDAMIKEINKHQHACFHMLNEAKKQLNPSILLATKQDGIVMVEKMK